VSVPTDVDLAWLDATAQAELVRSGQLTPLELVDAAIARIEARDGALNAVVSTRFEQARAESATVPDGPFRGVPMLLKDFLAHTAGDPVHGGLRVLHERDWRAPADSHLARRLRAAGFLFCGRTNMAELATSISTEPLLHGATHNPWDLARSPGGSSGGSAAAVAAGLVPVAHANDMGGSIRIPASACGLVGLKPTRGRTSLGPRHGEHWGPFTHEHVLTRSVRDSAALLDITAGPEPGDPYTAVPPWRPFRDEVGADPGRLRIGFRTTVPGTGAAAHPDCAAAVEHTARLLESLGHHVEPADAAPLDSAGTLEGAVALLAAAVAWEVDTWSRELGEEVPLSSLDPMNAVLVGMGRGVTAVQWLTALTEVQRWSREVAALWVHEFDVLVTPTMPAPPAPLGQLDPAIRTAEELIAGVSAATAFTAPFNLTGQPAVSLPLHWTAGGLPIGVQFAGAAHREDLLIRLAAQLEAIIPWADRTPPVPAEE
jgi:amidase